MFWRALTVAQAICGVIRVLGALSRGLSRLGGSWESVDDIALLRQSDRIFKPEMDAEQAKQYHDNWLRAVGRAEKWSQE